MTIFKHELKQNRTAFLIWTIVISYMLGICIFIYPEMKDEMENISTVFADMGSFSTAFGMDQINFGTLLGYYSIECGNVLGLGGAFFAALCGVGILAKEEKEHTAEFLLTHPVRRVKVITQKLLAVLTQIIVLNAVVFSVVVLSLVAIGENIPFKEMILLHSANLLVQIELASICFGISAFLRRGSVGIGLGVGVVMYFLNIISNITDTMSFLKYITPFAYANGSEIVSEMTLDLKLVAVGSIYTIIGIVLAYKKYTRKDIA